MAAVFSSGPTLGKNWIPNSIAASLTFQVRANDKIAMAPISKIFMRLKISYRGGQVSHLFDLEQDDFKWNYATKAYPLPPLFVILVSKCASRPWPPVSGFKLFRSLRAHICLFHKKTIVIPAKRSASRDP
jgi:hypothetical protein